MAVNFLKRASLTFINIPWGSHPAKVDISTTGQLEADQPDTPVQVQDYQTCAKGAADGVLAFLISDPSQDNQAVFDSITKDWNMLGQMMSWRVEGYQGISQVAHPSNSEYVPDALKAALDTADDVKRKVRAPYDGLDLIQLGVDGVRLGFIRKMKLCQGVFSDSLDKADAFLSQSITQRLQPIYSNAYPVLKSLNLQYLVTPLEPLRKLFAAGSDLALETKDKIAKALHKRGVDPAAPSPGTIVQAPPGGATTGTAGATGTSGATGTAGATGTTTGTGATGATGTATGTTATGTTKHARKRTTHKKTPTTP